MPVDRDRRFESVYSKKVNAGKRRTYFFDVRQTKGDDYYLTLTESTKRFNGEGTERHKIFLYKEDFNRFLASLEEVIEHVKTKLMPDYDYEEFDRFHDEWEARDAEGGDRPPREPKPFKKHDHDNEQDNTEWKSSPPPAESDKMDDDLSW